MNNVTLIGNMVADPELKTTQSGVMMTSFTIAVPKRRGEDGADFVRCTAFSKTAELITQYVKKGHKIGIVGRLDVSSYQDDDGKRKSSTKVVVEHIDFIERRQASAPEQEQKQDDPAPVFEAIGDEPLPF